MLKSNLKQAILGVSVLALLSAAPVFAQETKDVKKDEQAKSEETKKGEVIVVTGSRIRKNTFSSASPLTVINTENAKLAGKTDPAKIITSSTAASGSSQINNMYTGFIVDGGPGIQSVGLNSLGSQRTLVMLNSHRLPPSGVGGTVTAVDLQSIPSLAVSRYEILNEGASPIYGSDAVGGVVNMFTRKDVNGFEATAEGFGTFEGGGEAYKVGALWGKTADDWNAMISAEYFEQKALKYKDRDYCQHNYIFDANTGALADHIDPATGTYKCMGTGTQYNWAQSGLGTLILNPNNPNIFETYANTPTTYRTDRMNYVNDLMLNTDVLSPNKRTNIYGTFERDLSFLGGITVYGEGLYAKRESSQDYAAQIFPVLYAGDYYNPLPTWVQPIIARPAHYEQTVDTWQVLAGVKGETNNGIFGLLRNGGWDFYAQTSEAKGKYTNTSILWDRLDATVASYKNANGQVVCDAPASYNKCVPINWFDPRILNGQYTQDELDYLYNDVDNTGHTTYKQTVVEFNVTGDLFKVPGASDEAKMNIGAHYRKYSINDVPGAETLAGNVAYSSAAGITKGEDSVKEVYGELSLPLIAKKPLIEDLSVTAAYRYTNYDSYDSNSTWKVTTQWRITPEIKLVAISGTSYRAPNLYELFLGNQSGFGNQSIDPCIRWGDSLNDVLKTRCAAEGIPSDYPGSMPTGQVDANGKPLYNAQQSVTIYSGGGAGNLKEEDSRSDIFSLVWTPEAIDLNARLDFWKVDVNDGVDQFGAESIVNACYTDTTGKAANFCSLFTRDNNPSSTSYKQLDIVQDNYVNVNKVEVKGIDLKILYRKEFSFGDLTIDSQHRWTTNFKQGLFSDSSLYDYAGFIGYPKYVSQTQARFKKQDWTFAWTVDFTGSANNSRYYTSNTTPATAYYLFSGTNTIEYKRRAEVTIVHNASVMYKNDNWTLVAGINNLFDEKPPAISTNSKVNRLGVYPLTSQYDLFGRSAFVTVTKRF